VREPVLVVRARRLRAARGVVVARDVTLDAAPGEVVAVEGPNGSGKSTLLAAAAGLLPADNASVRPGSVGYSPERAGVLPRIPLQRWLLGLARTAGLGRAESARRAGDLLARLGLAHASAMSLHALSRGNALLTAVAVFLVLFVVRNTPMAPLLKLSTHPTTLQTPVGGPADWLFLPGLALVAVAAFLATRRVSA
jgi:ABC-type multidrug transport system ATPase subunit